MWYVKPKNELYHHGIKGQKWGVRRFQNPDGTLTEAGKKRQAKLMRAKDEYERETWLADERNAHGEISNREQARITQKALKKYDRIESKIKYKDAKDEWKHRTKENAPMLYANLTEAKANRAASKYTKKDWREQAVINEYASAMLNMKYSDAVMDKAAITRGEEFVRKAIRTSQMMAYNAGVSAGMGM